MIHYHGGPLNPDTAAHALWHKRHGFVSWARPDSLGLIAEVSQSFALDNGAFSFWGKGVEVDWDNYYQWVKEWIDHPGCDWAVIPDVIDGSEEANDKLIEEWPFGVRGVPVWHLNESLERLERLAREWPRVALGSTGEYDVRRYKACLTRLDLAIKQITGVHGYPITKLHGLRMLNPAIFTKVPLASADSTNIAINIKYDQRWSGTYAPKSKDVRVMVMADRIESELPAWGLKRKGWQG